MPKRLWRLFTNNLDTFTAIILSLVAGVYGIFGGKQTVVLSAIAGTLAVLSYSLIIDRMARSELLKEVQRVSQKPSVDALLQDRTSYTPLLQTISNSKHVYFLGPSLINVFRQSFTYLLDEKLKRQGSTIHVLLLDPESPATAPAAECIAEAIPERVYEDIRSTLRYIEWILTQDIRPGIIEARGMSVNPNYSMVLLDPDEPNGKIIIEIIGYKTIIDERPHIELIKSRDSKWYNFFYSQYRKLWDDSRVLLRSMG
jgi:hypothetical protein